MFNGLTENIPGLTAHATQVTVRSRRRHSAHAQCLGQLLDLGQHHLRSSAAASARWPVSGVSEASAQAPPNIDFYVLLDNSPSMALPATPAGITQMQSLTTTKPGQGAGNGGCAFACHQASTNNSDTTGNPCADGTAPTLSAPPPSTSHGHTTIATTTTRRADRQLRPRPQEQHYASS